MPFDQGEVISYLEMCREEGASLQRGMNFRLSGGTSVLLMSVRRGAPYSDAVEEEGKILVYEGHDARAGRDGPDPKTIDQPEHYPTGRLTQNGLFARAARQYRAAGAAPELVKVYEKLQQGIWVYNGVFSLTDVWRETTDGRRVFKFRLELSAALPVATAQGRRELPAGRVIPSSVKIKVWRRDRGRCVTCGARDNLHYDHIIPYSRGGSSLVAENVQLLCARHNLEKHDRIT